MRSATRLAWARWNLARERSLSCPQMTACTRCIAPSSDNTSGVETFLLDWLEREVPKFARSVNTRDNYAWAVRCHRVPGLGAHRLAKLTADHVDDLLEARAARGMAKNSLRRIRAVLVTALDHADRRELVRRNVAPADDYAGWPFHRAAVAHLR